MPVQLTFPGVYVQEVSRGDRAITGVATAVTAFVGRTRQGPVDQPVRIHSFADFERVFGGLWEDSGVSYAVRDYYRNGGQNAVIVRLYKPSPPSAVVNVDGVAAVDISNDFRIRAIGPGSWANTLHVRIRNLPATDAELVGRADQAAAGAEYTDKVAERMEQEAEAAKKAATDAQEAASPSGALANAAAEAEGLARIADKKADEARNARQAAQDASEVNKAAAAARSEAERQAATVADQVAAQQGQGVKSSDLFHLDLLEVSASEGEATSTESSRILESYSNVTLTKGPRRVDLILQSSDRIRAAVGDSASRPTPKNHPLIGGGDGGELDANAYGVSPQFVPALAGVDGVSLLCVPPSGPSDTLDDSVWANALAFCSAHDLFLLIDPPETSFASDSDAISRWVRDPDLGVFGVVGRNAAVYFPRVRSADPLRDGAIGEFVPCGAVAGIMARTDTNRGVWKAPAGIEAGIVGASGLAVELTDGQNGELNPIGINCLRTLPNIGSVVWGSRTLAGNDTLADHYKYVPVRRLALFLKESLYRGTQWVVFEPNDAGLWAQIRATLGAFMQDLFKQGAFQGSTPREAYFVKCDAETTTQYDIDRGIVNIQVGFAPLKPAEFVIISIQQKTATAA
jgi:uncharacterized protein